MIYAPFIALLVIAARVLHGYNYASKWLLFAPCLLAASGLGFWLAGWLGLTGFLPVLAAILLIASGANADNTLSYMYKVKKSSISNIVKGYSWRVAIFCAIVLAGACYSNWLYAALCLPMILSIGLIAWAARDNRSIDGKGELDRKHRFNVELSEGICIALCGASVWVVLIEIIKG